jgi:hypothetical protein
VHDLLDLLQNPAMRTLLLSVACVLLSACLCVCMPMAAHAALGGNAATVQADAAAMRGTARTTSMLSYDIRDISTDSAERIREFVSRNGTVFAVTWTGPVLPDLKTLLGDHFSAYAAALASISQRGQRRYVRVSTGNLVVESSGHMRAFIGRAYLTALLPVGVSAADLR